MSDIEVIAGVSIPYQQQKEEKKWTGTVSHSWDIKSADVINFAIEADRKVRKKVKSHGKFSYPLQPLTLASELEKHLKKGPKSTFEKFVNKIQVSSGISLKSTRVKSKLVLIFLKYKTQTNESEPDNLIYNEYFLVMLLKDKSALKFDKNGSPGGTNIIDFEDVMQAATFSLDEFSQSINAKKSPDVSFISGATDYFIEFLDAKDVIKNQESVNNLLLAMEGYGEYLALSRTQTEKSDREVKAYIDKNEQRGVATKLEDISSVMYNSLKSDKKLALERDSFRDFVKEFDYKINDEFTVNKATRDMLQFISVDTDAGSFKLKKSLIKSIGMEGEVVFNPNTDELTIKTTVSDPDAIRQLNNLLNYVEN